MDFDKALEQQAVEDEGVWVPTDNDGGEILVASAGNPEFHKKFRRLEKQWRKQNSWAATKDLPEEASEHLWRKAMVGTVLKGWRGQKREGREFPWSDANGEWALEESRTFRQKVIAYSTDSATFDAANLEVVATNLKAPSYGD